MMIRCKWQGRESSSEGRERDNENISHCIQDGGASQTCTCTYAILMDSFKVNKTVPLKQIIKQQKCVFNSNRDFNTFFGISSTPK